MGQGGDFCDSNKSRNNSAGRLGELQNRRPDPIYFSLVSSLLLTFSPLTPVISGNTLGPPCASRVRMRRRNSVMYLAEEVSRMKRRLSFLGSLVCLSALLFMPAASSKADVPQPVAPDCHVLPDGRTECCFNGWCIILEDNCCQ